MKFEAIDGTVHSISIMLTKLSILTFFNRFVPWGNLRVAVYIIMAIVVMYSLVVSLEWVYACRPLEKIWDPTITGGSCINRPKITIFGAVMHTVTDAAILILPILFLRNLRLPTKQKIGVIILLMTGGFVLFVSIIRSKLSVVLIETHTTDFTWESVPLIVWWTIEVHMAIVCACLPAGKPFLRKYMPYIFENDYVAPDGAKRRTIRCTHTQRFPLRNAEEDFQGIILEGDLNWKTPTNVPLTIRRHGPEQPVRTEYSLD